MNAQWTVLDPWLINATFSRRRPITLLVDGTILGVNLMDVMGHLGRSGDPQLLNNLEEIPIKPKDFVEEYVYGIELVE